METPPDKTSWTLVEAAAAGNAEARSVFVQRYLQPVRAYLAARWKNGLLAQHVDDAVQEVFLDCFRPRGALDRLDPARGNGFRAYLYGIVRNAALHIETRRAREHARKAQESFHPEAHPAGDLALSRVFDREWARAILRDALELQRARAAERDPAAARRVDLLRMKFEDGLAVRDIAKRLGEDPARIHIEYAQARRDFIRALREVIGLQEGCSPERLKEECEKLLGVLSEP
jgi:RNA polymerase sigma factor (sigma-70 family)